MCLLLAQRLVLSLAQRLLGIPMNPVRRLPCAAHTQCASASAYRNLVKLCTQECTGRCRMADAFVPKHGRKNNVKRNAYTAPFKTRSPKLGEKNEGHDRTKHFRPTGILSVFLCFVLCVSSTRAPCHRLRERGKCKRNVSV